MTQPTMMDERGNITTNAVPMPQMVVPNQLPARLPSQAEPQTAPTLPVMPGKIAGAIAGVMGEIGIVEKRGYNKFHDYPFARIQEVLQALTPLMAKNGIAIFQTELERSLDDGGKAIAIRYGFIVAHVSGEVSPWLYGSGSANCRTSKGSWDDKAIQKCHTGARKQFLLALFQVPTSDVEDGDNDDATTQLPERGNIVPPDRSRNIYDALRLELSTLEESGISTEGLSGWQRNNRDRFDQLTDADYNAFKNHYAAAKERAAGKYKAAREANETAEAQASQAGKDAPDGRHAPVRSEPAGIVTNAPSRLADPTEPDEIADLLKS